MSTLCGTTGTISKEELDAIVINNPSGHTTISSSSKTTSLDELLECDYETSPSKLYQAIEAKEWEDVLYFLETSTWKNSGIWPACGGTPWLFSNTQPSEASASIQAKTWVTAMDNSTGEVRWCQLPLHAAITFGAPLPVIQQLLWVYPPSARCADDHDLLPLHYAFRFGASDPVVSTILEAFPPAMRKRAAKDRLPLDLAAYSSRPERGYILEQFMASAVYTAQKEWNSATKTRARGRQKNSDAIDDNKKQVESEQTALLKHKLQQKTQRLEATLAELQATRDELEQIQRQLYEERQAAEPSSWKRNASFSSAPQEMPPPVDIADSSHFEEEDLRDDLGTAMTTSPMIRAPQQKQQPWEHATKEDPDSSLRSWRSIRLGGEAEPKQGRRSRSTTAGAKRAIRSIFGRRGRRPVDPE